MGVFICNKCGKRVEGTAMPVDWLSFVSTEQTGLRLYEKIAPYRYESFHVPNKQTVSFCSRQCAFEDLRRSIDMFLSEISPNNPKGRADNM